ncbi:MAG: TonB-dependent receptor plug domain-containing protein, partial [bacterium]
RNKITISGYGGEDVLDLVFNDNASDEAGFNYDWGNRTGSLRWTRVFSPQLFANFWLTGSRFNSDFDFGDTIDFTEKNFVSDLTFKANFEYYPSEKLRTNFGIEHKNLHLIFHEEFPGGRIDIDTKPKHSVAFIENSWQPSERWEFEVGVRVNNFNSEKNFSKVAPRFSTKFRLSQTSNIKLAVGRYYQFLHRVTRAFIADIWTVSNNFQNESSSNHFILGFQKNLAGTVQLEIEGFYKSYQDIYSFNQNVGTGIRATDFENGDAVYSDTQGLFDRGDGHSFGVELLLRKDTGVITGWLGYSFARTKYEIDGINQGNEFPPRHDRRSVLNLVGNIDIKNLKRKLQGKSPIRHRSNWKLGFTLVHSSGQPITTPGSIYFTNTLPDRDAIASELFPSAINNFRLPAYVRMDVSLTYEKHFRGWSIFPYLQIFNIGNRKNVWFLDYEIQNGVQTLDPQHMFPLLPSIGVKFKY